MNEFMGAQRFDKALDGILPAWRHKTSQRHAWTTPRGAFNVEVRADGAGSFATFSGGTWGVQVPATVAGLDALVVAMVLAGAIEQPPTPMPVATANGSSVTLACVEPGSKGLYYTPAGAFATGVALIERAGHTAGWRA